MMLVIPDALSSDHVRQLREKLDTMKFVDGSDLAGRSAQLRAATKHNLQADRQQPDYQGVNMAVQDMLMQNETFALAIRPYRMSNLHFSRYRDGMSYAPHVDNAFISNIRADVSFTLFLAEPEDYDGGELVIEAPGGAQAFKLKAGQMLVYPSTNFHRVAPVSRGERVVAVGWCQSQIRDDARREILYELELARLSVFDKAGNSREFDLLCKTHANLLRMWLEI